MTGSSSDERPSWVVTFTAPETDRVWHTFKHLHETIVRMHSQPCSDPSALCYPFCRLLLDNRSIASHLSTCFSLRRRSRTGLHVRTLGNRVPIERPLASLARRLLFCSCSSLSIWVLTSLAVLRKVPTSFLNRSFSICFSFSRPTRMERSCRSSCNYFKPRLEFPSFLFG